MGNKRKNRPVHAQEGKGGSIKIGYGTLAALMGVLLIGALALRFEPGAIATAAGANPPAGNAASVMVDTSGIRVVDMKRLLAAFQQQAIREMQNGARYTEQSLEMKGRVFGTDILREIKTYKDAGHIVVDAGIAGVLAYPDQVEITETIAERFGLVLEERIDPFASPALAN